MSTCSREPKTYLLICCFEGASEELIEILKTYDSLLRVARSSSPDSRTQLRVAPGNWIVGEWEILAFLGQESQVSIGGL